MELMEDFGIALRVLSSHEQLCFPLFFMNRVSLMSFQIWAKGRGMWNPREEIIKERTIACPACNEELTHQLQPSLFPPPFLILPRMLHFYTAVFEHLEIYHHMLLRRASECGILSQWQDAGKKPSIVFVLPAWLFSLSQITQFPFLGFL